MKRNFLSAERERAAQFLGLRWLIKSRAGYAECYTALETF